MSSGFFGFFAHTGFAEALYERDLIPVRISGSSAGALVGGALASGLQPKELRERLTTLQRPDFWDPKLGLGLLRGKKFEDQLSEFFVDRIEGAKIPIAVSAFDLLSRTTKVLNRGSLVQAVHASCAVPGLFHPVRIGTRLYADGGIKDRPGLAGMPRRDRILFHHLASKSPWRLALRAVTEPHMVTAMVEGLPRLGPFRLEAGVRAIDLARTATHCLLDQPFDSLMRFAAH